MALVACSEVAEQQGKLTKVMNECAGGWWEYLAILDAILDIDETDDLELLGKLGGPVTDDI